MKKYLCIDLKGFYASVECVIRGLDPLKDNLVVSDESKGLGAITLAITPAMKKYGVKSRGRLFEIPKNIDYIIAKPQMALYIEYSSNIYSIYLKYFQACDIHVYSIDEVFIDITSYMHLYNKNEVEIGQMVMRDIFISTKITSTCGIGTNLYLAKIALDIIAKINKSNIGYLDEELYIEKLGNHTPLTDFWQIAINTQKTLNNLGIYTMNDIFNFNEEILYKIFGIKAELLIDHSRGIEPCTIKQIKEYKPVSKSLGVGQILERDYTYKEALTVLKEMLDDVLLRLIAVDKVGGGLSIRIVYSKDIEKSSGGQIKFDKANNRYSYIVSYLEELYKKTTKSTVPIRKLNLTIRNIKDKEIEQFSLFDDEEHDKKEEVLLKTMSELKDKHGKNLVLRGISLQKEATQRKRNKLIGGHNEG